MTTTTNETTLPLHEESPHGNGTACAGCPAIALGLACPAISGRNHRRFCALHEREPETWGPTIVALARADEAALPAEPPTLLAPLCGRSWGVIARKPWEYRVTATFAHLGTPAMAALVVGLLRLQTERPYIVVVDTGSSDDDRRQLEQLRAEDCEIHYVAGHAYQHTSDPVALACDLAFDRCQTDLLFYTHSDCFLRSRDLLARWADRCTADNPLVGYQISDRSHLGIDWSWMFGHTALMQHVPTAWKIGARWSWRYGQTQLPGGAAWDTEYGLNWAYRRAGIVPELLGSEVNYARNLNADFDHVRSAASSAIYRDLGSIAYRAARPGWLAAAQADARARIARWSKLRLPLGVKHPHCAPCLQSPGGTGWRP